jgi:hypothetical protein
VKCAACGRIRPASTLLAFWPVGQPDRPRYVCRPSLVGRDDMHCFVVVVGPRDVHAIALADAWLAAHPVPADSRVPARPGTVEWHQAMFACGVRAAA